MLNNGEHMFVYTYSLNCALVDIQFVLEGEISTRSMIHFKEAEICMEMHGFISDSYKR